MPDEGICAALFDLDGVIIDSEGEYTRFWSEIDRLHPTGIEDFAMVIKGTALPLILQNFAPELHTPIVEALHAFEQDLEYEPYPGALQFISALRRRHIPTAIVTSSDAVKMGHLFNRHPQLQQAVDVVINSSMITRSKPDPQGYLLAAERLGVDPCRCIVFEDSIQGLTAGRNAGCAVVGITTTNPVEVVAALADIVSPDLASLTIDEVLALVAEVAGREV